MQLPKPTGKISHVRFEGSFLAKKSDGLPVVITLPGIKDQILLVYSTPEKLKQSMSKMPHLGEYSIQIITDAREFLESVFENKDTVIYYDLHTAENGKERWVLIDCNSWLQHC
jgi:hypothetical protein